MEKISMNKKYKTSDGKKVQILSVDIKNKLYPVAVIVTNSDGEENILAYTEKGNYLASGSKCGIDLIEVKEKKKFWVNVYKRYLSAHHESKEHADHNRLGECIACVEVEYVEGQGL